VTLLVRWEKDSARQEALVEEITLPASVALKEEDVVDRTNKTGRHRKSKSISNTNKGE